MSDNQTISGFISIFEGKVKKQKERIQKELDKPKKERNRHALKEMLKEANKLKRTIKQAKKQTSIKCPHCGGEL